jgi:hypothetical protein
MTEQKNIIKSFYIEKKLSFTTKALSDAWSKENLNTSDDFIVAFIGPEIFVSPTCKTKTITKDRLHLIIRHNGRSFVEMELIHRMFCSIVVDILGPPFSRRNNDILYKKYLFSFFDELNSEQASFFHFSIFMESESPTSNKVGLIPLDIDPENFAITVMNNYIKELNPLLFKNQISKKPIKQKK